jgi:hypothetical protein
VSASRVVNRAVASLLDVVEELVAGLAEGRTPTQEWSDVVADTFEKHRQELLTGEVQEDERD